MYVMRCDAMRCDAMIYIYILDLPGGLVDGCSVKRPSAIPAGLGKSDFLLDPSVMASHPHVSDPLLIATAGSSYFLSGLAAGPSNRIPLAPKAWLALLPIRRFDNRVGETVRIVLSSGFLPAHWWADLCIYKIIGGLAAVILSLFVGQLWLRLLLASHAVLTGCLAAWLVGWLANCLLDWLTVLWWADWCVENCLNGIRYTG